LSYFECFTAIVKTAVRCK